MRVHSKDTINKLKRHRKMGYSINELVAKFSIPKTTVWHHVHDIPILPKYISVLKSKRGGSAKRKQRKWEEARQYAQKLIQGPDRELVIVMSMLYWGEGSKKSCDFINSDGLMIRSYLGILKRVLKISKNSIRPTLRIFSGMNKINCLKYWSNVTKIPQHKFIVRLNDGGTKGKTKYGMCRITIKKGGNVLKLLHSLINQISEEIIKKTAL